MNYYDELGLNPAASADEIRQAYKRVARLLHPDQHNDEHLRKMAELQMTRLNEILETLMEPARRERYNASFNRMEAEPKATRRNSIHPSTLIWGSIVLTAVVSFVLVFLNVDHDAPAPIPAPVPSAARRPSQLISSPVLHSEQRIAAEKEEPDGIADDPPPPRPRIHASPDPASSQIALPSPIAAMPLPAPVPLEPVVAEAPPFSLTGTWLYTRRNDGSSETTKSLAYPPEYIEMNIKPVQDGRIAGRYRGQFQVPDQALSPEIAFSFEGPGSDTMTQLPWHADDGASGQIRLKILSGMSLQVSWYTTTFGSGRKLASGSAVLFRN